MEFYFPISEVLSTKNSKNVNKNGFWLIDIFSLTHKTRKGAKQTENPPLFLNPSERWVTGQTTGPPKMNVQKVVSENHSQIPTSRNFFKNQ